jgi:hypothetical protein
MENNTLNNPFFYDEDQQHLPLLKMYNELTFQHTNTLH